MYRKNTDVWLCWEPDVTGLQAQQNSYISHCVSSQALEQLAAVDEV